MTITPRKRRITEALKPHLRHGPKAALVDAVDVLLAEAEQTERTHRDRLTAEVLALEAEADDIEAALRLARGYVRLIADRMKYTNITKPADDLATIDAVLSNAQRRIRARGQGQAEAAE